MKKIFLLLPLFIFSVFILSAQEIAEPHMIDILPSSPEASEFVKNIDMDLNEFIGQPTISIPIGSISLNNLQWPVSLTYDAGGLKVEEEASAVGANWTLNAMGLISRVVRQHPDEQGANNSYRISQNHGYFSDMAQLVYKANGDINTLKLGNLDDYENLDWDGAFYRTTSFVDSIADGFIDTHADMYYYSFGGHSGKFYFTPNRELVHLEHNTLKFKEYPFKIANYPIDMPGESYYWEITDEKGITYKFEKAEKINTASQSNFINETTYTDYQSAWYLTEMSIGSEFIKFQYENNNYIDTNLYTESRKAKISPHGQNKTSLSTNQTTTYGFRIKSITSSKNDSIVFHFNTSRLDKTNKKKLDKIEIFKNFTKVKEYVFFQSYFGSNRKLRLDSVQEENGNLKKPPHVFEYISSTTFPSDESRSQDLWGYYNSSGANTLIPEYKTDLYHVYQGLADRSSNFFSTKQGALKRIYYPTGGYHEFEYELNKVFDPNYQETFSYEVNALKGTSSSPNSEEVIFEVPENTSATIRSSLNDQDGIGLNTFSDIYKQNSSGVFQKYFPPNYDPDKYSNRNLLVAGTYKIFATNAGEGDIDNIFYNVEFEILNPQNREVGGLRVKQIKSFDGVSKEPQMTKTYEYVDIDDATRSSGVLFYEPYYGGYISIYRPGEDLGTACLDVPALEEVHLNLSAYTSNILTYQGSHVGYKNVNMVVSSNAEDRNINTPETEVNGKTKNEFFTKVPDNTTIHPYVNPQYFDHMNGKLTAKTILNSEGVKLQETKNFYSEILYDEFVYIVNTYRTLRSFCYNKLPIVLSATRYQPKYNYLDSTITTTRDRDNREILTKTYYEYDRQITKPTRVISVNQNSIEESFFTWKPNFSGRLNSKASFRYNDPNLIDSPIDQKLPYRKSYKKFNYSNNQLQSTFLWDRKNNTVDYGGAGNLSDSLSSMFGSVYNTYFASFNGKGDIIRQHLKQNGNIKKLYQWDGAGINPEAQLITTGKNEFFKVFNFETNGNYPVGATGKKSMNGAISVSIENVPVGNYIVGFKARNQDSSAEVMINNLQTSIPITINENKWDYYQATFELSSTKTIQVSIPDNVQLDDLVIYPDEAEITYFTIEDGKGISSQTDSNGNTTFFEYDDLGRLIQTKDNDQNMLSKTFYKYKNFDQ